jgi:hypothetical protein
MNTFLQQLLRKRPATDDPSLPQERRFRVGEREVVVRAFTLAELKRVSADLGAILQRVASEAPDLDLEHIEAALPTLLPMLSGALEELLAKLLGVEPQYLMQHLTAVSALQIVRAMLEVNQLPLLLQELKRLGGLVATSALAQ